MEKRLAQVVSYIFHPLLMPTYCLILLLSIDSYFSFILVFKAKLILLFMTFSSTVVMPAILFSYLKYRSIISDFQMRTKEERLYPYLGLSIVYFLLYYLFSKTALHPIFSFLMLTSTVLALALFIINRKWKISAHTAGMGGLTAMMIMMSFILQINLLPLIIFLIFISGIVGFARLKTNSHKPAEIYSGYLAGAIIFTLMFLIL